MWSYCQIQMNHSSRNTEIYPVKSQNIWSEMSSLSAEYLLWPFCLANFWYWFTSQILLTYIFFAIHSFDMFCLRCFFYFCILKKYWLKDKNQNVPTFIIHGDPYRAADLQCLILESQYLMEFISVFHPYGFRTSNQNNCDIINCLCQRMTFTATALNNVKESPHGNNSFLNLQMPIFSILNVLCTVYVYMRVSQSFTTEANVF